VLANAFNQQLASSPIPDDIPLVFVIDYDIDDGSSLLIAASPKM